MYCIAQSFAVCHHGADASQVILHVSKVLVRPLEDPQKRLRHEELDILLL